MKYVLVGSPDKISLSRFVSFLRHELGKDYEIGDMHSLMSEESKERFAEHFSQKNIKGIFSYYAKGVKATSTPVSVLPKKAVELSDVVIWFDLYSTTPVVVVDRNNLIGNTITKWGNYIDKLSY
jgi:hypothetical protein